MEQSGRAGGLKVLSALVAAVVVTVGIGACSAGGGGKDEITVAVSSSPSATAMEALAPAFTKQTGIKVNFVNLPYAQLAAKVLLSSRERGHGYDVIQFDSPMLSSLANGGALADIGSEATASASYDYADIPAQVQQYAKYHGTTYALPLSTEPYVLWYNTKLFTRLGLKPPTTWSQYAGNAAKLSGAGLYGNDSGFGSQLGAYYWLETIYLYGGSLFQGSSCVPDLTSPAARAATSTYLSLLGKTPATAVNGGGNEMTTAFTQGNVGQMVNATGYYSIMADPSQSKIPGQFAAALPPTAGPQGHTLLFGWLIGVGKNSSAPSSAWKFLQFALAKNNTSTFIAKGAPPAARTSLLSDPAATKELPYLPTLIGAAKIGVHLPYITQMPQIITTLSQLLSQAATRHPSAAQAPQAAAALTSAADNSIKGVVSGAGNC
jgi:ABC-type glycerol-3-phosphate transport system substrate-binding protein